MIDYIKLDVSYLDSNTLYENEYLDFNDTFNQNGGEWKKSEAEIFNLKFILATKMKIMEGSLHKYYNIQNGLGNHNHSQFTYDQILWVINDLKEKFGILPEVSKILNLEYGVNLEIDEHPTKLLQSKVMFYKYIYPNSTDFKSKGYLQEFHYGEYKIKMYDKGSQYHLGQNLLRYEVRTKKSRVVGDKLGIRYLTDLSDPGNLRNLHTDLKEKMNDIYIYDCINPIQQMTELENHLFTKSQSRSFFHNMQGPSRYNQATKARAQIRSILSKYNLNTSHKTLIQNLESKKFKLLPIAC